VTPAEAMRTNLERYQARRDAAALMSARFLVVGCHDHALQRAERAFELDQRCLRLRRELQAKGLRWRSR
jgi:hypothetical protein